MRPDHFERLNSCCRCRHYDIGSRTCVKHEFYVGVKSAKNHICKDFKDIALGRQHFLVQVLEGIENSLKKSRNP